MVPGSWRAEASARLDKIMHDHIQGHPLAGTSSGTLATIYLLARIEAHLGAIRSHFTPTEPDRPAPLPEPKSEPVEIPIVKRAPGRPPKGRA